ncbi:DUF4232 domain-containing protein [Actinomycetota bacterium Odt1-20B]
MRVRKLTFAALAVAAGLSLAACNGDDTAQSDPSSAPTKASSGGGSGAGGSDQGGGKDSGGKGSGGKDTAGQNSGGQGAGSGGSGASDKCRTDDLDITASDSTIDGDPEGTVAVTMKNGAGHDCVLAGYAGVDLKTSEGSLSAQRSGEKSTPVTLKDGESVSFGVTYPLNESGGSGVGVTSIVVTPPNETKSFTMAWPGAKSLPVTDGSGSPVKVGPMGSAGQGGAQ